MRKVAPVAMPRGTISFWCGQVYSSRGGQFLGSAEGETVGLRLLAVILTERNGKIRVITAYELDAGQKRHYLERRMKGE